MVWLSQKNKTISYKNRKKQILINQNYLDKNILKLFNWYQKTIQNLKNLSVNSSQIPMKKNITI
jgi:hypothetical protein